MCQLLQNCCPIPGMWLLLPTGGRSRCPPPTFGASHCPCRCRFEWAPIWSLRLILWHCTVSFPWISQATNCCFYPPGIFLVTRSMLLHWKSSFTMWWQRFKAAASKTWEPVPCSTFWWQLSKPALLWYFPGITDRKQARKPRSYASPKLCPAVTYWQG